MGLIKDNCGDYTNAIVFYEKSLEILNNVSPITTHEILLATSYSNMGLVHQHKGEFLTAISFYEKALEICEKNLAENSPRLATIYCNIAMAY